jgi:hypothetical protein
LEKTIKELAKQQAAAGQEAGGKPVAAAAASSIMPMDNGSKSKVLVS